MEQQGPSQADLRWSKNIYVLGMVETVLAILILAFGIACTALGNKHYYDYYYYDDYGNCSGGTAIWIGILCLVSGILNIVAGKMRGRARSVGAYTMAIISSVFCGILFIVMVSWVIAWTPGRWRWDHLSGNYKTTNLALDILLLIFSLTNGVCCVVSAALFCKTWRGCCPRSTIIQAPPVVFVAAQQQPYFQPQPVIQPMVQPAQYYVPPMAVPQMAPQASGMAYPPVIAPPPYNPGK